MKAMKKTLASVSAVALTLGLVSCSDSSDSASGGNGGGDNYILANGSEPQNPLVPANTNETGGGRIIDVIFSGLVRYDTEGKIHNEVAESIEKTDDTTYEVKLKDWKFSDGSPVTANSFVDAWNLAVKESMMSAYFFEPIKGYKEGAEEMEGLKVVDDKTFTIELSQPTADFETRLGYSAFFPLPESAFEDIKAFGENPISNGPYKLSEWAHNQSATIVPNEHYEGDRKAQNDGVTFTFYPQQDAAYSDLLAGNLDVLDAVPDSAFATFEDDLGDRAVNQPAAVFQSFTIPNTFDNFKGEEGKLRRQAISLAINREEITDTIFQGTRTPATDFTTPVLPGHSEDVDGSEVLEYDPEKAKELWEKAEKMGKFEGSLEIAYNADGGHKAWADATANSIKNVLDIEAAGKPYPDFKSLRDEVTNKTIKTAFRTGWQADYPGAGNFLEPLYATGASSNDGDYSNKEFDAKLKEAAKAESPEKANEIYQEAQEILFEDLPAIPLWYSNVTGGSAETVSNVTFNWKSVPEYFAITKE